MRYYTLLCTLFYALFGSFLALSMINAQILGKINYSILRLK